MDDRQMADAADRRGEPDEVPRVAALGDLGDFQVAEGYPDPRGWNVMGADGMKIGKVHDLIVDTGEMRTRYLDVTLYKDAIGAADDHDVLLPVGAAQLDDTNDHVMLGSLTPAQLGALPEFTHGEITRDYEDTLLQHMPGPRDAVATAGAAAATDYYATHHFDDKAFFNRRDERMSRDAKDENMNEVRVTRSEEELEIAKRNVQAGEVDLHKRVETEHVTRPVTTRREEVTIERRPVRADQDRSATGTIGDGTEIRIPITEEELVVEKRAVVKEELVIRTRMVTEEKTVEGDIRKEKVDIDRSHEHDMPASDNNPPGRM
ncbi:MAG: DUF2382 domain-containing protein [Gemmatimonadota bacterium]|nr:DUF2382 domain-containing protein [Gemmatimonadota bacterium]